LEILNKFFPILDEYRKKFLVGELIWNFADFQTMLGKQSLWTQTSSA